jgi:4-amino-4-deoxy-L-arabinose transferase-like glycosyltransferase
MNNHHSRQPNVFHSISQTFYNLWIAEKDPAYIYWLLGGITLFGLLLRLSKINEPIAYDEAYTFIYFATKPFKQILSDYSAPNNHILNTIFVSLAYRLLGGHAWIVRLPAFLAGTLCIPAAFFAARRFFDNIQSLAAAMLIAWTPWFISYSTNGRGYTLVALFSLVLANFAGLLVHRQSRLALIAYGLTAALGFYSIPVFLYPMAGISLWVLVTYLTANEPSRDKSKKIWIFLIACGLAGVLTFILYAPVIFFGTGIGSIFSNEFVEPRDWTFVENLLPRAERTWTTWMQSIILPIQYMLSAGFLLSVFFYKKVSKQRIPLQIFLVLAIAILLPIQRVAPLARVWFYLGNFYMLFAGVGLIWFLEIIVHHLGSIKSTEKIILAVSLFVLLGIFAINYISNYQDTLTARENDAPEKFAAEYLASHAETKDKIISVAPVDYLLAYYLYMKDVPYDVFYQRDHPTQMQNALIVLRENTKYKTPDTVLDFYHLSSNFDLQTAKLIYQYGPLKVFTIPAK